MHSEKYHYNCDWATKKSSKISLLCVSLLIILVNQNGYAQEEEEDAGLKSNVIISFGYTHVPSGSDELNASEAGGLWVPSIGIDYMRRISEKWGVGIMLDYELDHYLIVEKELERENVFIAVAGIAFEPIPHLLLFTGAGIELEHNENLFVYRLGAEYGVHLNHRWLIAPAFFFDWKEGYDTYALSLGLGYNF